MQWLNGGPAKPAFVPPRPFERGVRRPADTRPERRDARERRAHRPLRRRWFRELGNDATSRARCCSPSAARWRGPGSSRSSPARRSGRARAPRRARRAVRRARRRLLRHLAAGAQRRSTARSRTRSCARSARRSAHARSPCYRARAAASPRRRGSSTTWPGRAPGSAARASSACARSPAPSLRSPPATAAREPLRRLRQLAPQVAGRGACAHPNGATRLVESALAVFADELGHHLAGHCTPARLRPCCRSRP